ncbi:glycoside hydrolase family 18 protein [Fusarium austroafricanum]|uniref:chitinase n=1 Tax=Fusarium austroafricanum TaxID=2364996 RepID=A0A8H4KJT4_9HYPO|nr:glycoside hydrolase family 18 protein [Fusarium austroafricanum]
MSSILRCGLVSFIWGVSVVQSAINLDGSQAVDPVTEDDPSPIADINTYHPDQHDCPPSCVDYTNTHSWIPYFSVERLDRCQEPLLLQFSISQPLGNPGSTTLIRSCSIASNSSSIGGSIKNPKKGKDLFQGGRLATAPACMIDGDPVDDVLRLGTSSTKSDKQTAVKASKLLQGMKKFFEAKDNCDEKFLFAYHQQVVAGVYIGAGLGKVTAKSALGSLAGHIQTSNSFANETIVELCGKGRRPDRVFGISVDTTGNLAAVQNKALQWSKGISAFQGDISPSESLRGVKVFDIAGITDISDVPPAIGTPTPTPTPNVQRRSLFSRFSDLGKRAVCRHIPVEDGDSCTSLSVRCGIRGADFLKYNPQKNLCSSLNEGDHVCCSSGNAYKPDTPKPGANGICATHLIDNGDTCAKIAKKYSVTVKQLESWNKGKTWAWTDCNNLLLKYNMCVSSGSAPMPPPQKGTECGPLVPGTSPPKDSSTSLADLNPCPLKACCSNWGFCGVFPDHCKDNAPEGGGPGSKKKGFQNTCVSNCGNNIKENSGPPKEFGRIGYYEAYNLERDCLWLKAKDANTDGSYTHIHWAFASIDPQTWKPVIDKGKDEWSSFKKLKAKRIVSFGGWDDSTKPDKYQIIRSAIIANRELFAANLAKFAEEEDIDGIDIDWEYPGATDILAGGNAIGAKSDGLNYLRFLTVLRDKLSSGKSVSIAAPASYWYLKAFPIDKIAEVVDYIVYMTYDLHGQWDYGNPNAFDMCESGKCIRSHVTKAGVPNNKIFVGESSYGRSFRMAKDGCWKSMCEFTGSRTESDANPGRCTKTGGYLAYAEIQEIVLSGKGRAFYDEDSESDIILYDGDYVSYLDPRSKLERRVIWQDLNFGGSIDWAVDLQEFGKSDFNAPPDIPKSGEGCIEGWDLSEDTADLCYVACAYGFCPESKCECTEKGPLRKLPLEVTRDVIVAEDPFDVDLNRLCKFGCKYGYCPREICKKVNSDASDDDDEDEVPDGVVTVPPDYDEDSVKTRDENDAKCYIYKKPNPYENAGLESCKKQCQETLDEAAEEGWITNYGCVSFRLLDSPITWQRQSGTGLEIIGGQCSCDNWLLNEIAVPIIEALPAVLQIGCYLIMSTFKFILDIGLDMFAAGRVLNAGADMLLTATEIINYFYPESEDPQGAFEWWLAPCGGSDLVPDEIKEVFDILSSVPTGRSSFRIPKGLKKGGGKKGDEGNPRAPPKTGTGNPNPKPKPKPKPKPNPKPNPNNPNNPNNPKKPKCTVPPASATKQMGQQRNTLRLVGCDRNDVTTTSDLVVTTMTYAPNAAAMHITKTCPLSATQACYNYRSIQSNNPHWSTLTCPQAAAMPSKVRLNGPAVRKWAAEHGGDGWQEEKYRKHKDCEKDEFPPVYLLDASDEAYKEGGKKKGQRVRWLPRKQNKKGGDLWKSMCFKEPLAAMSLKDFHDFVVAGTKGPVPQAGNHYKANVEAGNVDVRPRFHLEYELDNPGAVNLKDDGLWDNPCWPKAIAKSDPGFVLLSIDEWYAKNPKPKWEYQKPYSKGSNGD